jgi:hypothetical protein
MTIASRKFCFQTDQHLTQFLIWNTLLKMNIPAYNLGNLGEVVDKTPASGATFFRALIKGSNRDKPAKRDKKTCCHEADPVKTDSPDKVNFLRKFFSRREDMCRDDSDSTLQTYTSIFDDEEEEEENFQVQLYQPCRSEFTLNHKVSKPAIRTRDPSLPTPVVKGTPAPRPTPIIKDTRIPVDLKLVALASCWGEEVDNTSSPGAFMCRAWHDGDSGRRTKTTRKKVSFHLDEPKSELNFKPPVSFYQLILVDGKMVPKRVYPEPLAFYQLILVNGNLVPKRVSQNPSHRIEHT